MRKEKLIKDLQWCYTELSSGGYNMFSPAGEVRNKLYHVLEYLEHSVGNTATREKCGYSEKVWKWVEDEQNV